jgi:hypothetical protein
MREGKSGDKPGFAASFSAGILGFNRKTGNQIHLAENELALLVKIFTNAR